MKVNRVLVIIVICLVVILGGLSGFYVHLNNQKQDEVIDVVDDQDEVIVEVEEKKDVKVSFMAIGDNLLHQVINIRADENKGEYGDSLYNYQTIYENIKDDIKDADLAFINQEIILGGEELGLSGYPTFNAPIQVSDDLHALGFDMVNTATNHSLDRFSKGIANSHAAWARFDDMIVAGTYISQEDRDTIRVIEREGIKFSLLAYTYGTNGIVASNDYEVAYFDEDKIKQDVAKAKEVSDVIIVSAHWGDENTYQANSFQRKYAQLFADLEVDLVVGTHPHVIQPIEYYTGVNGNELAVVYSLGNSISGMVDFGNIVEGMITCDFIKDKDSGQIRVENLLWTPLVDHYQTKDVNNFYDSRYNFKIYKLSQYNDDLARSHALNHLGKSVTVERIKSLTNEVIDAKYRKE